MKNFLHAACILSILIAGLSCGKKASASELALPEQQKAAIQTAVCLSEPKETVQAAFADLASAPAGSSQRNLLRARLSSDNLSMFCLTSPINADNAAADYVYETPTHDQMGAATLHTVNAGTVVAPGDISAVTWVDDDPGFAHGSFRFDTSFGNRGTCLFLAMAIGDSWKITKLAIQKKGSDKIEDGYSVF